ncbi:MAG: propionyl-CoA synthetase [Acidimicrobiia bacterium]|nr:propionyl-CoA synthetase [Acidimicrobiia bacterium]
MATYQDVYRRSRDNPQGFWRTAAYAIDWDVAPSEILDDRLAPLYRWYPDAVLNTCYNALDRHVERGRGEQAALIYDSPVTETVRSYSYRELRDEVAVLAGALRSLGVTKGDRVVIYMPMIPETAMAMLACSRIGAVHSVVFGGFAANELATRIDDAKPKVVLSASCGIEPGRVVEYKPLLDRAIELSSHKPNHSVVFQRPELLAEMNQPNDLDWVELTASSEPAACVPVSATDPLYILYTSGTTGVPKGVVRDNGGHAVALAWSMKNLYGAEPGDVYWAASDVGWVVGHSYIVYGPLIHGCTSVLYEGKPVGTPDPGAFWRVISQHGVSVLFTAPTAFRAIRRDDPQASHLERYDLSSLETLFLAGERCDPDTLHWAERVLGVPVIDHWWQTETGWPVACNPMGIEPLAVKPGSPAVAVPGYDIRVLDDDGQEVDPNQIGAVVLKLPLPPGTLPTLWNADDRYRQAYLERYPGYYLTSDAGFVDEDGYLSIMSRIDDIINVAGHRLSTGAIEEVLAEHPDVAECAVIGVADELKGQLPMGFVVLQAGTQRDAADLSEELVQMVRNRIGPVAAFKQVAVVTRLPKTRSGKILRSTMRKVADGDDWSMPATIDDPLILDEIGEALGSLGYPRGDDAKAVL